MKNRKKYWENSYREYWAERVSKKGLIRGDCAPPSHEIFEVYLDKMGIKPKDKVIDIGCGFGRFFPVLVKRKCKIYGIDISSGMIKQAARDYGDICCKLKVAEAEHLPFKDNLFDKIICWAVFDALSQKEALIEMNRTLKRGGIAMITGKNDNYHDDDDKALVAEVNAMKKGHPNYFTNLKLLLNNLPKFGFQLNSAFYFERRGDFSKNKSTTVPPVFFYEYVIFIEKLTNARLEDIRDVVISDKFSKTFKRVRGSVK